MSDGAGGRFSLSRHMPALRYANFRLLFFATLGSGVGTWMATIALTLDVFDRTGSTWWVAALLIVTFVPSVIVGLFAGPLVDLLSRKRLVVTADLVRLAVFCALPFVGTPIAIIVLAGVAGTANSFFRPAVLAGVPNLVSEGDLAGATSLLQATDWLATAVGPILGGAIVAWSGPNVVYWINAARSCSRPCSSSDPRAVSPERAGHHARPPRDLRDGFDTFRQSRALVIVLVAFGLTMLASGLVNVSEIALAKRSLASGAFGYGLLWTASGAGLVIGSLIMGTLVGRRRPLRVYPLGFVPWAAGITGAALAPNVWVAALAMAVAGFGNGVTFPMTVLIIQEHTIDRLRGRAFTLVISVHNALLGLAMIAAGALTSAVGARWTFAVAGALIATGGLTAFLLARGVRSRAALPRELAA